jgi:hypothetical protein
MWIWIGTLRVHYSSGVDLDSHPDPHHFGNMDPHPHSNINRDPHPDPHQSDKLGPEPDPESQKFADDKPICMK